MTENNNIEKQIKFAVVMYGGGSLAIYINGVAQELLKLAQATTEGAGEFAETVKIYRKVALFLSDKELQSKLLDTDAETINKQLEERVEKKIAPTVSFIIDVLTGSSAGGINAVFLAKALVNGSDNMDRLRDLWLEQGDFAKLLNDRKSVTDNNLPIPQEPASLLNSRRMYLELLKALDGLTEPATKKTKLERLDLFVTYTDFAGLPTKLVLSDKTVLERQHKRVFNFRYENDTGIDDFIQDNNPFLAFAARSTSSFPLAFEPMRLEEIDSIIDYSFPEYKNRKSDCADWKKYFRDLTDDGGNLVEWEKRWLVDGGCLDNKPFGYAVDKLTQRTATGIVERKLLYIEPEPEEFITGEDENVQPDALQNVVGQASDLPRYETIREDLRRVLDRNRLINRVAKLTDEVERDFKKNADVLNRKNEENKDNIIKGAAWQTADLKDVVQQKGAAFLLYYRLRISAVTDDIAWLVSSYFKIEDDSDYFKAIRTLIRSWRGNNFFDYKAAATADKETQTLNNFIYKYDIDYRLRRLNFVIQKAENLLLSEDEIFQKLENFVNSPEKIDDSSSSEKYVEQQQMVKNIVEVKDGVLATDDAIINALPQENKEAKKYFCENLTSREFIAAVKDTQRELIKIYRQLRRENDFLREGLGNADLVSYLQKLKPIDEKNTSLNFEGLEKFQENLQSVEEKLGELELAAQNKETGSSRSKTKEKVEKNESAQRQLSFCALERILKQIEIYKKKNRGEINEDEYRRIISDAFFGENSTEPHKEINQELIALEAAIDTAAKTLDELLLNKPDTFLRRASGNAVSALEVKSEGEENYRNLSEAQITIRNYLRFYYELFDSYDQISYPIYFESPVGEAVEVDVIRISSRDAHSLIDEENPDEKRRKLAGNYLANFGAFLDPRWRLNDIMWGRLDGAERLITTLLSDDNFKPLRDLLIKESNLMILDQTLIKPATEGFRTTLVSALTTVSNTLVEKGAIEQLVGGMSAEEIRKGLRQALINTCNEEKLYERFTAADGYVVDRRLDAQPTLQMISRATQIGGRIMQNIAEKHTQAGDNLSWIARVGQIFWGLVTVAAPNSIWNLLFVYWIQLLYSFEVVLIIGATVFAKPDIQQFGIIALLITLVIHLAVTTLHDEMLGDKFWRTLLRFLLIGVAAIFAVAGVFLIYSVFINKDAWSELEKFQRLINKTEFERWQKLIPLAPFIILFALAALWREIEKLNLQIVGRALIVGYGAVAAFSWYFGRLVGADKATSPMIDLEFVSNAGSLQNIINNLNLSGHLAGMKMALMLDTFAFVPLYLAFLLILSALLGRRRGNWGGNAAIGAAVCAVGAAIADWTENYSSIVALKLPAVEITDQTAQNISNPALIKWSLIFLSVGILSTLFWRGKKQNKWFVFLILFAGFSIMGLIGTFFYPVSFSEMPLVTIALISIFNLWLFIGILFQFKSIRESFLRFY